MALDCMKMGLNYQQVIAFLDQVGIAEENSNWVSMYLN